MKATCLKENLGRGLSITGGAIAGRNAMPILQNVLMEARDGKLKLSGTNLETTITTWMDAEIHEPGRPRRRPGSSASSSGPCRAGGATGPDPIHRLHLPGSHRRPQGEPLPDRGREEQHRSLGLLAVLARDAGGVGHALAEFNETGRLTAGLTIDSSHILTLTNHR